MDVVAKEAAIARFLREYPRAVDAGRGHPALRGGEDIRWSEFPDCPAAIPVLLHGFFDQDAASEARRVLANSILNSVCGMNAAMPEVLPFLFRLVSDPRVPGRSGLVELLSDSDHPEREQCRAVFAEYASVVPGAGIRRAGRMPVTAFRMVSAR